MLGSVGVDRGLPERPKKHVENGEKGKGLVTGRRLDRVWLGTTGVIVFGVGNVSQPSHRRVDLTGRTPLPATERGLMILDVCIHEATGY